MNEAQTIAKQLNLRPGQIQAAIELFDAGNTLPFIARYRKEMTGSLDDEQLRQISSLLAKLRSVNERRQQILATIAEQGHLTPTLQAQLEAADSLTSLEDLYQPYKPKRRTRAGTAREKGLQPLADLILGQAAGRQSPEQAAQPFLKADVPTIEEALAGARDIVAEIISDNAEVRGAVRQRALQKGLVRSQKIAAAEDPKGIYQLYYDFELTAGRLRPHQILALNRGEAEKVLRVDLAVAEQDWLLGVRGVFRPDRRSPFANQLQLAIEDAANRLLLPAIERDVRRVLTGQAEAHAIQLFATNLRGLLNQPPLAGRTVLGLDPGYRTGCKIAIVDPTGKVSETATIYPHNGKKEWQNALERLADLVKKHQVGLITIGNGTAGRETEQLVAELISQFKANAPQYLIVNEAGASVYSASQLAQAELPGLDVTLRGAVSIARRAQDPLAELVKIEPKAIGVGLYQHDVDQKALATALDGVVETVVNQVGVDVNTASPALLTYVAGIGPKLAAKIVAHRDEHGPFPGRVALRQVSGLGPKAFEQSAGFLRIRDGQNPLDGSAIHPESYPIAQRLLQLAGISLKTPPAGREQALKTLQQGRPLPQLAEEWRVGLPTLNDISEQLARPGRDPRQDAPPPLLRSEVMKMEDLRPGMTLHGTVRNVVDFGAFVDIGVKQDGLLHRSHLPPDRPLTVGDTIEVAILTVEPDRGRISLALPTPNS